MNPSEVIPSLRTSQAPACRSIDQLLQTLSASRLATWLSCRLKFYFRYVVGLPKRPSAAMHVGSVLHAVLQQWNLARWHKDPLSELMIRNAFEQFWNSLQEGLTIRWDVPQEEIKTQAYALLEAYLQATPVPLEERPEGVEVQVEMDLGRYGLPTLVGILDLVRMGGLIIDYKTTARTPASEMVLHNTEIQTTTYALLYREATGRKEAGVELHHLVRLKKPKLVVTPAGPATSQQSRRLFRLMDSYVQGLQREDFVPSPGLQCASCEFFHQCRHWS